MPTENQDLGPLAVRLGAWLLSRRARLGLAESCTGGWAAKVLTDVPGASDWFWGGVVVYDPEAKTRLLGVPPELIAREGVVSIAVVSAMVMGLLDRVPALTYAAAVSGVAGPTGGDTVTPVGTVCLAWARRGEAPRVFRCRLDGGREDVRREAVRLLLAGVCAEEAG